MIESDFNPNRDQILVNNRERPMKSNSCNKSKAVKITIALVLVLLAAGKKAWTTYA